MARPRAFAEDEALDAAMQRFWRLGYAATSVRDLGEAMGLGQASVYNAFGDKQALFARALDRYLDRNMRERIARLEAALPPRRAIEAFLEEIVERSLADPDRCGCLLVNTALEVAPHDAGVAEIVAARLRELETFFRRCTLAAQRAGSVARGRKAADVARLMLATVMGLRVLARVRPERALLEGVMRQALTTLDCAAETSPP
jgi:TetR/AcrR family transcriptional repressor of nem operon